MTLTRRQVIDRARTLVGVPFRPQGRDPTTGLDCVGVVLWVFAIPSNRVRRDYRLRDAHGEEIATQLNRWFDNVATDDPCAGDVILFAVSEQQNHLAINCGGTFVHADAWLRRVVETPNARAWAMSGIFRNRQFGQPE